MAIRSRPPRSVSDIKTHSGSANNKHENYRKYFQVGALELERWRREREREAASSRIADIDNRIADIDREKNILLEDAAEEQSIKKVKPESVEKKSSGLRIKY
jgi:hypothetical protein